MIIDIQNFLKEIMQKHTSMNSDKILLSLSPSHTSSQSICIVPFKGNFTPIWSWEKKHLQQDNSKTQKKYSINQPFIITFCYHDKEKLISDIHEFLKHLPRYGFSQQVEFIPSEIEYQLAEGTLGFHKSTLLLHTTYGIVNKYTHQLIKNVDINTSYK